MIKEYLSYSVKCDHGDCEEEFRGTAGEEPSAVVTRAWDFGWDSSADGFNRHYCQRHKEFAKVRGKDERKR